ncbi:hypothetical protein AN958_06935 [Leucoagaricus sp. SymC.cos]|nr:hypothetical protein AN958_06935 [Leucoagaricus sp. SymC.cos]
MRGPAGVGKSAIAQTCAERVKDAGHLGAAFFFSISGRNDHRRFFPSLAYHLTTVFPEYRQIVSEKIQNDRSIVKKTMKSQFNSLIVEPLQELAKRGKQVGRRAIFIDGLDECQENEAQVEIIELIVASIRNQTIPFRWAFFSRPEPHIKAAFDDEDASPLCRRVLLPISREVDGEIELYLRGGFKNILRRRNLSSMSTSWPAKEDIEKLVDASAGLFAYPAAVLRFVDSHSFLAFEHTLQAVLNVINGAHPQQQHVSPFTELDALYLLILERIPADTLPYARLLLTYLIHDRGAGPTFQHSVAGVCNDLGFSEVVSRGLFQQLHAVIGYEVSTDPLELSAYGLDSTRSFFTQQQSSSSFRTWLWSQLFSAFGSIAFHHKSFADFLADPARSLNFCVTTPAACEHLFNHFVDRHCHVARSLSLCDLDIPSFSFSLSWPHGSECVDSYLLILTFNNISTWLTHDHRHLPMFLKKVPLQSLQKLNVLEYRKYCISDALSLGIGLSLENSSVIGGYSGTDRVMPGVIFSHLHLNNFNGNAYLAFVQELESLGVIERYHHPSFPTIANPVLQMSPQYQNKQCGQYKLGHGDKAIYWYWELDIELGYFHEFRALDFVKTMTLYQTEKFKMWEENWEPPSCQPVHALEDSD